MAAYICGCTFVLAGWWLTVSIVCTCTLHIQNIENQESRLSFSPTKHTCAGTAKYIRSNFCELFYGLPDTKDSFSMSLCMYTLYSVQNHSMLLYAGKSSRISMVWFSNTVSVYGWRWVHEHKNAIPFWAELKFYWMDAAQGQAMWISIRYLCAAHLHRHSTRTYDIFVDSFCGISSFAQSVSTIHDKVVPYIYAI